MRDVRLKLERADEHFKTLYGSIEGFLETNQDRIPGEFHPETSEYVFPRQGRVTAEPDESWGPILGDIVHNTHAALDYLVCQLLLVNGGTSCDKTAFPIYATEEAFRSNGARRLTGVHPDAVEEIERLQPFQREADAERHARMILYRLEQWDKHRMLHTAGLEMTFRVVEGWVDAIEAIIPPEEDNTIAKLRVRKGGSNAKVHLEPVRQVVFDSPGQVFSEQGVLYILRYVRRYVAQTAIPALEPFLK